MPLFRCVTCGCIENTATSNYWKNRMDERPKSEDQCSACDPRIGKWHGEFTKDDADALGYRVGRDGYLYEPASPDRGTGG